MTRATRAGDRPRRGERAPAIRRAFVVPAGDDGSRLDHLVRRALEGATRVPLSNADVRRVIVGGGVQVDRRTVRGAGRPVGAGARVSVVVAPARLASQQARPSAPPGPRVVFEDADLLAVDKPPGLPTVPTADARRDSLVARVRRWLASRAGQSAPESAPGLGVHQRLDAVTSGVVMFSKTPRGAAGLDAAFASGQVVKTYLALCAVRADGGMREGRIDRPLDVSGRGKRSAVAPSARGRSARTGFTVREQFAGAALVEARPETGRKHQVRAHLAEAGLPLLGDGRYGGPAEWRGRPVPRPLLHAARLQLPHPVSGRVLVLEAPLPDDFQAWLGWLRASRPVR